MLKNRGFRRLLLRIVLISSLGFGLSTAFNIASLKATPPFNVQQSVAPCFPKVPIVSKADLAFEVRQDGTNYYLMSSDQSQGGTDLLISVDKRRNSCSLLLFNPMGDTLPLSRFVPLNVAEQFALQQVKKGIAEAGSRASYQKQIMQVKELTSDDYWAIQKLGFKIPKNVKVIAPEDIKISPDQSSPQSYRTR